MINKMTEKKLFQIFLILSLSVLITGCGAPPSKYANTTIKPSKICAGQMSMLVAKISVPYVDLFNRVGAYPADMEVVKLDDPKKIYLINGTSHVSSALMIEPGTYYIESISWNDGFYIRTMKARTGVYRFTVAPGECVYLGDIFMFRESSNERAYIKVENNLRAAVSNIQNSNLRLLSEKLKIFPLKPDKELCK